jgi:hypothetical protein
MEVPGVQRPMPMPGKSIPRIAYFVSPHGFGHAARACAVMDAVHDLNRELAFDVYAKTPRWFFDDSLSGPWTYHPLVTDVGFVQKNPLEIDLHETLSRLDRFYPVDPVLVADLAHAVSKRRCGLVVCDIAPLGIEAAKAAGIPSVLIENFTWDWLYDGYQEREPGLRRHVHHLGKLFDAADFHLQTEPVCQRKRSDLVTGPVNRKTTMSRFEVRKRLGISNREKMVLLTMGGIQDKNPSLEILEELQKIRCVVPGASRKVKQQGTLTLLPHRSEYFHPDLVAAADAVVGKVGYSTLAETYSAGVPFGYIVRRDFRESQVLVSFVETNMRGMLIAEQEFYNGAWVSRLDDLLALPRIPRKEPEGAKKIAEFLVKVLRKDDRKVPQRNYEKKP